MDTQATRPRRSADVLLKVPQVVLIALTLLATPAAAQTLVAVDDSYGVPYGEPLVVEQPGVMDNDTYGGAPAADEGATVTLLTSPDHGLLDCESDPVAFDLCPDGSFTYTPYSSFSGFDSFAYEVTLGGQTQAATVTLTACTGGPTVFMCWLESSYLAQLGALGGFELIWEGFEDDAVWGVTRDPERAPSVVSQGVRWESNHPDPPASNELMTNGGSAYTGLWGLLDPDHGYATGTPQECDINNPPDHCLFKDGFTGTRQPGETPLLGVGAFLRGSAQPNLSMILDGGAPIGLGRIMSGHQFFGVIDAGGFDSFRVQEMDGKVGQERYVFGDDFILATTTADTTPPQVVLVNSWQDTGDGMLSEGESTDAAISQLLVVFSESVRNMGEADAHSVTNPDNYLLFNDGGNGFETASCSGGVAGNDGQVLVTSVTWQVDGALTATLDLNGGTALSSGHYRLLVCGTTSIKDWSGNTLDGDGNGTGGDDFVRNFSITAPVNSPPVADPQSVSTPEDTAEAITLTGSDPDGDPMTFSIVTPPGHGGLSGAPPNVTYTPAANYNGPDGFTFRIWDGTVFGNTATVSITVTPVNDPPTADPQSVSTPQDTAVGIVLTGTDPDGDPMTFSIVTPPGHGGLSGAPPDVTYTPTGGYFGPDSFTFRVWDGSVFSNTATVSITVTEVGVSVLTIGDASITEGDGGSAPVNVTITLTPASGSSVSVDYATGGGTATAGNDYVAAAGTANIPAGQTSATVPVQVNGDLMDEPEETFGVTLSNPVGAELGAPSTGTVTIFDDDPMPDLSAIDVAVPESSGQALVELTLSAASGYPVSVDYTTADGTATSPGDYGAVAGTATVTSGQMSTTVAVAIVDDQDIEADETFTLELSNPSNGVLLTLSATVTIEDDDNNLLFEDGFESGDWSEWSAAVP